MFRQGISFASMQQDDTTFSHANQVKNMVAQFGMAAGVALATLCMQWRSSLHFVRLNESLSTSNPAVQDTLQQLTQHFASVSDPANAARFALAHLAQWTTQEATLMASLDYFAAIAALATAGLVLVLLERGVREYRFRSSLLRPPAAARKEST